MNKDDSYFYSMCDKIYDKTTNSVNDKYKATCLKCGKPFISRGKGNRICKSHANGDYVSPEHFEEVRKNKEVYTKNMPPEYQRKLRARNKALLFI